MIAQTYRSITLASVVAILISGSAFAAIKSNKPATHDSAVAVVKSAVAFIKKEGPAKAYAEISNKSGQFTDHDMYVVVYGLDGKVLAHGQNENLIGTNASENKDADGHPFVKERIELARKHASFWQNYKFMNPVTKKIEAKHMYCMRLEETAVCGGVYKLD
jgi:cytochrome c